jgi:hypothetical protein
MDCSRQVTVDTFSRSVSRMSVAHVVNTRSPPRQGFTHPSRTPHQTAGCKTQPDWLFATHGLALMIATQGVTIKQVIQKNKHLSASIGARWNFNY